MAKKFVSDVANFAIGLGHLRNSCPPPSGHVSREETRQVLAEINNAKSFLQSRGAQGSLNGLKKCSTLSLMRKESIPLTPAGFFNWLTVAEQQLEAPPPPSSPANKTPTSSPPPALNALNQESFWDKPWLNLGDTQVTTKELLLVGLVTYLFTREGYHIYQRRSR